jgi:hypothetical protein
MPQPPFRSYFQSTICSITAICHMKCEVFSGLEIRILVFWDAMDSSVPKDVDFLSRALKMESYVSSKRL